MSRFFPRRPGLTGEFLSARYLLIRAIVLVLLFLIAHVAGLREHTSFLSGTPANSGVTIEESSTLGVIYIVLYLGAIVVGPIFAIAAGMLALWHRLGDRVERVRSDSTT